MRLQIIEPNAIDASPTQQSSESTNNSEYKLNFYKNRKTPNGHMFLVTNEQGEVLSQYIMEVSEHGQLKLRDLTPVDPSADLSQTNPESNNYG